MSPSNSWVCHVSFHSWVPSLSSGFHHFSLGSTTFPEQQVRDRARGCVLWSYHRNFLSSIAAAAASPLIRAVDPRRPAPHSGHRVAPRPDNRLSPSSLHSRKLVLPDCLYQ